MIQGFGEQVVGALALRLAHSSFSHTQKETEPGFRAYGFSVDGSLH
jgi:hypothetical protein